MKNPLPNSSRFNGERYKLTQPQTRKGVRLPNGTVVVPNVIREASITNDTLEDLENK
jgi:hypothetical protein